jgi:hypothetical protein
VLKTKPRTKLIKYDDHPLADLFPLLGAMTSMLWSRISANMASASRSYYATKKSSTDAIDIWPARRCRSPRVSRPIRVTTRWPW